MSAPSHPEGIICLVIVALLSGCAHRVQWLDLTSQHFVVHTNLAPEAARSAAVQLEHARAILLGTFPPSPLLGTGSGNAPPLEVVVFASPAQLQELSGDPLLDAALTHDWRGPLLLTSSSTSFLEARQLPLTLHQLAHHFSAHALRRWPRWFEEGLASYVETITIDPDAKSAVRGAADQLKLDEVVRWGILPVESLWAWDVEADPKVGLEKHRAASAWFWVHFLFNLHRKELDGFMRSLSAGEEPREAWPKAFGNLAPEALAEAARAYIAKGQVRSQKMDLELLNTSRTARSMPDAQVHALFARVAAVTGAPSRARAEALTAAKMDARDPKVQEQLAINLETVEARVAAARQLVARDGKAASSWVLLGQALPASDPERGQALAFAAELDPKSFLALSELAAFRCAEGKCAEGVPLAERAASLAPGDARVQAAAAAVQWSAALCPQAVVSQQRALEVFPHRASAEWRKQLQTQLAEYQRCLGR